jgi:hypothetical protein
VAKATNINRLLRELRRQGGGARQTSLRVLGGKLRPKGAPFHKEHVQFEDPDEGPRTVDIIETGTCAFGHTIDDKVRVAGLCELGREVVCSTPGCALQCCRCGAVVCARHSRTYGDKTYCLRCRWHHWWRVFWRLD